MAILRHLLDCTMVHSVVYMPIETIEFHTVDTVVITAKPGERNLKYVKTLEDIVIQTLATLK